MCAAGFQAMGIRKMSIQQDYQRHIQGILEMYRSLMSEQNIGCLVIPSGIPAYQFLDDNAYPYKVNVHFKALVPLTNVPKSYILIRPEGKPQLFYYQPVDYWHVVPETPNDFWVESFDVELVSEADAWQKALPANAESLVWMGPIEPAVEALGIRRVNPEELLNPIHYRRAIKTDYEITLLREAALLGAKGHRAAEQAFRDGGSEQQIHLAYLAAVGCKETELPYTNIIGLNQHAAILHYTDLSTQKISGDERKSFLIDAGADYRGYYSDITRTYAYHDDEFATLCAEFDDLQLAIVDELKPGQSYVEMHIQTHYKIAEFMIRHGFLTGSVDGLVEQGVIRHFFPHGLGHFIGLQVHDIGGHQATASGGTQAPPEQHPFLRLTRELEAGHVVTIEPGMYFIDILLKELKKTDGAKQVNWDKVEAFKPYGGIRIEDDVLVTETGHENLSREAFKQLG